VNKIENEDKIELYNVSSVLQEKNELSLDNPEFMNKLFGVISITLAILLSVAFTVPSNNKLDKSLVGHWSFDEQEGNIIIDHSTFKSNGEIKGLPKRVAGIIGNGCLELDGKGDYIEISENGKTPSQLNNLGKGSISIWFNARNIPVGTNILPVFYYGSKKGCANMKDASNEGLIISLAHGEIDHESQGIYFTVFNNPCEYPSICFDSQADNDPDNKQGLILEGEWYHFVAVVGENFNTGYLNGEEIHYRSYNFSDAEDLVQDGLLRVRYGNLPREHDREPDAHIC